ncbi:pyruvate formate lyase family protein [Desulfobacula phenolica]|uniref:Formate C-acetyltransferase n=1 Tax=Desulfobacula phenolica TaxID=90732 RepID=A0A1H2HA89_9BACT|nr:pyruvate formate lyase family protein [Desulfobacula phenolica]SDU28468.1 formate C-acetyltransferase [Desulfobacula phenolica]
MKRKFDVYKKTDEVRDKLKEYTPGNLKTKLPLLDTLLELHRSATAAVDIERAKYMTAYLKETEHLNLPMPVRRAEAVAGYLSNREICFHDDNMLGGATTAKALGAPVYPEFFGLSIWPELGTISTRKDNPQFLDKKDADILNFDVFPYWMEKSMSEEVRKVDPFRQGLLEKMIIYTIAKAATISHTTPCYELVLEKGIQRIMEEAANKEEEQGNDKEKLFFYRSVRIAMQGILDYAANISREAARKADNETDPERKKNLQSIAEICKRVPAKPAETYHEAVNALWICQVCVFAENSNMAINPGRLDQILYPYFIRDYESGVLSIEEALNISGSLWFKIADNVNLVPEAAEKLFGGAGAVPAVTLGGVDKKGNNAVNELTYVLLKITELLPIRDPNVNARFHPEKNPVEYRNEVSRVILTNKAIPAFFNDIQNIRTLVNQGETLEHARDYAVIGCVELGSAGRDYSASSSIFMMMYTILYMTLHNGRTTVTGEKPLWKATGNPSEFNTFEDFWDAYAEQTRLMAENAISLNNTYGKTHQQFLPTPLLSAIFKGPLDKGKDLIQGGAIYNSSGVTHIGFPDVCDSICAIKDLCFNENDTGMNLSLAELVEAVDNNFKGHELLCAYLKNKAPKYGTDHPVAVDISGRLIDLGYEVFNTKQNYRGGNYRVAYWTMTNHAGYGSVTGALPSGRKANIPFSSGITPASQIDTCLTTALNCVAGLNSKHIPGAYALNMKFSPVECSLENADRFGSVVQAYMEKGGQQVQFNIQDYKTLEEARADPDSHPHLLVRVSGYSAYFKSLNEAMKDELIMRSQYKLSSGEFVPLIKKES